MASCPSLCEIESDDIKQIGFILSPEGEEVIKALFYSDYIRRVVLQAEAELMKEGIRVVQGNASEDMTQDRRALRCHAVRVCKLIAADVPGALSNKVVAACSHKALRFAISYLIIQKCEPPPLKSRSETSQGVAFYKEAPTMKKQKVKKISVKRVEDTDALQWARVANRGEEKRSLHRIKVIERAATIRCSDLDREKAAMERFLVRVNASTGHLREENKQHHQLQ
ncbi:hypothetical protein NDU88_002457 [Pleurodeles waltl]|uniref:Uncharacterized protein n=1 Tax=Pleurodeles waltl TaxID=8319 RepID=A0AAV7TLU4_PLEWA|nr:hypothetical protein NDU88_002457 [Pleurodeles waltl]